MSERHKNTKSTYYAYLYLIKNTITQIVTVVYEISVKWIFRPAVRNSSQQA